MHRYWNMLRQLMLPVTTSALFVKWIGYRVAYRIPKFCVCTCEAKIFLSLANLAKIGKLPNPDLSEKNPKV